MHGAGQVSSTKPARCDRTVEKVHHRARHRPEWATGWQDDASPVDHRAWSVGVARARSGIASVSSVASIVRPAATRRGMGTVTAATI
jgi:hypothetical protein